MQGTTCAYYMVLFIISLVHHIGTLTSIHTCAHVLDKYLIIYSINRAIYKDKHHISRTLDTTNLVKTLFSDNSVPFLCSVTDK